MKTVKVFFNGEPLRDVYPHATRWQVVKFKVQRFFRKAFILSAILGVMAFAGYVAFQKYMVKSIVATNTTIAANASTSELENIINTPSFQQAMKLKARTILVERESTAENTRHDVELKRLESDKEQIRKEELTLGEKSSTF